MGGTTQRTILRHGEEPVRRGPAQAAVLHLVLGGATFFAWASMLTAAIGSEPEAAVEVAVVEAVPLEADFTWLDVDDVELAAEVEPAAVAAGVAAAEPVAATEPVLAAESAPA